LFYLIAIPVLNIETGKVDTPNTQIHDRSLSWLDTPNTQIHDCSLSWLDTPNTQIHDCSLSGLDTYTLITRGIDRWKILYKVQVLYANQKSKMATTTG
jgi:hypothetical protein